MEKWKKFLKFFDLKSENEFQNFDFCFLKLVLNQNRVKKNSLHFSFFNALIKFEKWKIFFEIRFFISVQKANYEIVIFILIYLKLKHEKLISGKN